MVEMAQACRNAGANDLGGTLMNETITRAIGRTPVQRTIFYGDPPGGANKGVL